MRNQGITDVNQMERRYDEKFRMPSSGLEKHQSLPEGTFAGALPYLHAAGIQERKLSRQEKNSIFLGTQISAVLRVLLYIHTISWGVATA